MSDNSIKINMSEKSKVKNLCDWQISWAKINYSGDETIKPNGSIYITNDEIDAQVDRGNLFFIGTDGMGSHARVYIENPEMRKYLGFDSDEEKRTQFILDEDKCKQILEYKSFATFKKHIEEEIVTNQEKAKIINYARKVKLNDYEKIQFLEIYCNIKFNG